MLTATLDEVDCLLAFDLVNHLSLDASALNCWCAHCRANHKNLVELNFVACFCCKLFDTEYIARRHFVLLAAGFQNRKHMLFLCFSRL